MRDIDIYQDEQGYFSMGPARFIHRADRRGPRVGKFVATIYCDRGTIREPFNNLLNHTLDEESRLFQVEELLERASKPPEGLRIGIQPWASHPPPVNETDLWVGRILSETYSSWGMFSHWQLEAVGHSEEECESGIRSRLRLAADDALPPHCVILAPSIKPEPQRMVAV